MTYAYVITNGMNPILLLVGVATSYALINFEYAISVIAIGYSMSLVQKT